MLDYKKLEVLPQVLGICWFNAVLTVLLYSQGVRKIVKEQLKKIMKTQDNKFLKTLKYIIDNNYNDPDNIKRLFRGRFTLEFLLFKYIELYNKRALNVYLKNKSRKDITSLSQWEYLMLISILKDLKINFKDLYYYDGYLYEDVLSDKTDVFNRKEEEDDIDPNKKKFDEPPEILVLFNEHLFPNFNKYQIYSKPQDFHDDDDLYYDVQMNAISLQESKRHKYEIDMDSGIQEYKEEITFNGVKYKLESCLLLNKELPIIRSNHVISGITYNNESFVHNGWITRNKQACSLFKRDWKYELYNETPDFCINRKECSLPVHYDEKELCFNFSKNRRVLVYVKVKVKSESVLYNKYIDVSSIIDNINSASLKYSSHSLKEYLRDYFDLKARTTEDLKEQLVKIGYDKKTIDNLTPENIRFNLEDEYKRLFKVKQTDTNEIVVKKFIIKLLKRFIKDYERYNYINLFKIDKENYKSLNYTYLINLNKAPKEEPKEASKEEPKEASKEASKEEPKLINEYIDIDLSKYSSKEEVKEEPKLINEYINIDLSKYSKGGYIKKKRVLNKYK